jgi:sec-independent protein translocase protein TatA
MASVAWSADKGERRNLMLNPLLGEIIGPDGAIVLLVVLVLFGGSQLPKLARGLGAAQREFKKGLEEGADDKKASKPDSSKSD